MVSKRNFFSIAIMMFILLFLFQFLMVMRDYQNVYNVNSSFSQKTSDGNQVWKQEEQNLEALLEKQETYVLFIGDTKSDIYRAAESWCEYTKRNIISYSTLADYPQDVAQAAEMIILENENYAYGDYMEQLKNHMKRGSIVVISSLDNADKIQRHTNMKNFLGIRQVVDLEKEVVGVRLFEGLLLGGEVIYKPANDEEKEEQMDFQSCIPWYQTASGTKTYMVGLLEDSEVEAEKIKNEDLPALIWRNGSFGGNMFVVAGNYMSDSTAIGLLDGMVAESNPYTIYPIVNAQNFSIINFPGFADENSEKMVQLYSRSTRALTQDVVWPALVSISENTKRRMTCFMQPQTDYTDDKEPDTKDVVFFLKQMKEQSAEAGISMQYRSASSLEDKLIKDAQFFADSGAEYEYGAAYVNKEDLAQVLTLHGTYLLEDVSTFVCDYNNDIPLLSYVTEDTTLQMVTNNGMHYTYSDDFRMRSIQTALGYTNVSLNIQDIFWPKSEADNWQVIQEEFSSNLSTYWRKFTYFTSTTISESNSRVRAFLNLDYSFKGDENETILYTTQKDTWFLLRTHGQEIGEIVGGSFEKLEEDVYLIHAQTNTVRVVFTNPSLHYHT